MAAKKRILVVDDEPDLASSIKKTLENEGYVVDLAYDGKEGMDKVRRNPPDAIVLDVMMPVMDGYSVCTELKNDINYSEIPIVMLTAVADHVSSTRYSHFDGMNMEADDYIPKPASSEDILESIKRLVS